MIRVAGQSKPRRLSRHLLQCLFELITMRVVLRCPNSGTSRHFSAVRNLVAIGGIPDFGERVRPADLWVHALGWERSVARISSPIVASPRAAIRCSEPVKVKLGGVSYLLYQILKRLTLIGWVTAPSRVGPALAVGESRMPKIFGDLLNRIFSVPRSIFAGG